MRRKSLYKISPLRTKIKKSPLVNTRYKRTVKDRRSNRKSNRRRKSKSPPRKKSKPLKLYCGNNFNASQLVSGNAVLGTRHGCLKRGFGRGYHEPVDVEFLEDYVPIDNTKVYCGNKEILPEGYDRFGNLSECMRKGYGAGKKKRTLEYYD